MWRLLVFVLLCGWCDGYRVLLMFPVASKSHAILGEGYVRHLLAAGHEVTYITPYPLKNPPPNFRQIDLSSNQGSFMTETLNLNNLLLDKDASDPEAAEVAAKLTQYVQDTVSHENFQKFIMDKSERYDVVVVEWLYSEVYTGLSAVFDCPFIWSSSMEPHTLVLSLIDEHINPSYVPDIRSVHVNPLTFRQRVSSLLLQITIIFFKEYRMTPTYKQMYETYFGPAVQSRGRTLPAYDDVVYNGSLILGNSHVSLGDPVRLPQNYIPIGGYHVDTNLKPLPDNIQKIMDNAKDGVIYFSMGSILKSADWPTELKQGLLKMFGELKQTVIWKFEEELENTPKNVHLMKWAPQNAILNHTNCAIFITHGGLLSITEAIHYGIPVIGIPVFADQFANIGRAVNKGFAAEVKLTFDVVEDLKKAINDMIGDSKYKTRAKELSFVYHDRPVSPGAELVHWVQHAASTGGAPHLRSAALSLAWYQKAYLDLAALVIVVLIAVIFVVKKVFSCLCRSVNVSKKNDYGSVGWKIYLCFYYGGCMLLVLIFPMPGKSHSILGEGIVRRLLDVGHEVTYLTPFPMKDQRKHLHHVDVSEIIDSFPSDLLSIDKIIHKQVDLDDKSVFLEAMFHLMNMTLASEAVRKFVDDPKQAFDVVIAEWLFTEIYAGFAALFDCPLIYSSSMEPHWMILQLIDEKPNPAYTASLDSDVYPPFSFMERFRELKTQIMASMLQQFVFIPMARRVYERTFSEAAVARGRTLPRYEEVIYSASLVLGNSHVSLGEATRLPQNYKPIGGYHIETLKPLPENLKKIIDVAKHGVVYFSMGSNLKSKDWPDRIKKDLLKMFGSLKQTVLWKFEEDLKGLPENVHILKWAPQPSILAHPNCLLFITHGGLLSTTEAIHYSKPVIGIPVFADQFANVGRAVKKGFAKRVDFTYNVAEDLKVAIHDMLADNKYKEKVEELSLIYHDRPVSPDKELVHWVEHVAKTKGARHLRSAALLVPWYQKMFLDLALLVIFAALVCAFMLKMLLKKIFATLKEKRE